MGKILISDVQVVPVKPQNGLVAFISFVLNEQIYLGNLGLYTSFSSPYGFRLVYPTRKLQSGVKLSLVHPISKIVGATIEKQVVDEYQKIINELKEETFTDDAETGRHNAI